MARQRPLRAYEGEHLEFSSHLISEQLKPNRYPSHLVLGARCGEGGFGRG